jgi:hypothetical protein
MSLEDAIRKARGKDLTSPELHNAIRELNKLSNEFLHGDKMRTFKDRIESSNTNDIVKRYNVDGKKVELKASHFTVALSLLKGASFGFDVGADRSNKPSPDLWVNIKKVNDEIISVSFFNRCDKCHGTGETDCPECEGTGEHECYECNTTHECGYCDGTGTLICEYCEGNFDEKEVVFYDEIQINQGELF